MKDLFYEEKILKNKNDGKELGKIFIDSVIEIIDLESKKQSHLANNMYSQKTLTKVYNKLPESEKDIFDTYSSLKDVFIDLYNRLESYKQQYYRGLVAINLKVEEIYKNEKYISLIKTRADDELTSLTLKEICNLSNFNDRSTLIKNSYDFIYDALDDFVICKAYISIVEYFFEYNLKKFKMNFSSPISRLYDVNKKIESLLNINENAKKIFPIIEPPKTKTSKELCEFYSNILKNVGKNEKLFFLTSHYKEILFEIYHSMKSV